MDVEVVQVEGFSLKGKANTGHWVPMDIPKAKGGGDTGATPFELLVMGLCGCTTLDIISILESMHVPLGHIRVTAKADRATEHPTKLERVHLTYHVTEQEGHEISPAKLERAIKLSEEKYCGVSATIKPGTEITWAYEIIKP